MCFSVERKTTSNVSSNKKDYVVLFGDNRNVSLHGMLWAVHKYTSQARCVSWALWSIVCRWRNASSLSAVSTVEQVTWCEEQDLEFWLTAGLDISLDIKHTTLLRKDWTESESYHRRPLHEVACGLPCVTVLSQDLTDAEKKMRLCFAQSANHSLK